MSAQEERINAFMMRIAKQTAAHSPDCSRGVGAVIMTEGNTNFLAACNTFPTGVTHTAERKERPIKYEFIEHAERAVIYSAYRQGVRIEGAALYVTLFPCCDCARAIIASGIRRLYVLGEPPNFWGEDADKYGFRSTRDMFSETGVNVTYLPEDRQQRINEEWAASMAATGENYGGE